MSVRGEKDTMNRVQIMDKTICILISANTFGKAMNPIVFPQALDK